MQHPFQCVEACFRKDLQNTQLLIAACGPFLFSASMAEGKVLSIWSACDVVSLSCSNLQALIIISINLQ